MEIADKARCWDSLKEACFELMQPKHIFGVKFPSEKNKVAQEVMQILVHVEMTVGKKKAGAYNNNFDANSSAVLRSN